MEYINNKNLFLCSTPFQAKICLQIIKHAAINNYDVIYLTRKNDPTDRYYYDEISQNADKSIYFYNKRTKKGFNKFLDLKSMFDTPTYMKSDQYSHIYIASIDNVLFRYIIKRNPSALIHGFDDGAANITSFSSYYKTDHRTKIYIINKILNIMSANELKLDLHNHYSIYPNFNNIVSLEKVIYLPLIDFKSTENNTNKNAPEVIYFIGQPFEEYLSNSEIEKLKNWLGNNRIDFYVPHPRETKPLNDKFEFLEKSGLLAEDAIYKSAEGRSIHIIAGFSTVLFNISSHEIKKTYLSINKGNNEDTRLDLISKTNSKVLFIE